MHQTKKGNQWHFWHEGPHLVSMPRVASDPQPSHHRGQRERDLNQLGNLEGEEQFVSADAGNTKGRYSARSWLRWMRTG